MSDKGIRVLSLGSGQSNFLTPLYREIRAIDPQIRVDIVGYEPQGAGVDFGENGVYERFLDVQGPLTFEQVLRFLPVFLKPAVFKRLVGSVLLGGRSMSALRHAFEGDLRGARFARQLRSSSPYQIYHFHFCTPESTNFAHFIPPLGKCICSIWGSDLLRGSGNLYYFNMDRVYGRADIITVCSPELREIFLAKFGRHLKPKIRYAQFPRDEQIYALMDEFRGNQTAKKSFRERFDVPSGATLVVVGQNAKRANNQMPVVESLGLLPKETRKQLVCFFPLTYGGETDVLACELKERCQELKIECRCLTNFLDWEDLALLRLNTDVLIYLLESDAMSATVTESLYGGATVIAGSWLPYGVFRRMGLNFIEVDDFEALASVFPRMLADMEAFRQPEEEVRSIISKKMAPREAAQSWVKIIHELAENELDQS